MVIVVYGLCDYSILVLCGFTVYERKSLVKVQSHCQMKLEIIYEN